MVSYKTMHGAFITHITFFFLHKPIRETFHSHHLPKLYIYFNKIGDILQIYDLLLHEKHFAWEYSNKLDKIMHNGSNIM